MIEQFDGLERKKTFEFLQAGKNRNDLTVQELKDAAHNSLRLIAEEFSELLDACGVEPNSVLRDELAEMVGGKIDADYVPLESNPVEIVDAVCDIKVVLANFEYFLSIEQVCDRNMYLVEENNLTKVDVDYESATKTIEEYKERGIEGLVIKQTHTTPSDSGFTVFNKNGKIMKPSGYVPVELIVLDKTIKHIGRVLDVD